MRTLLTIILLALAGIGSRAQDTGRQTNDNATAFPEWQKATDGRRYYGQPVEVTCKPAYYRRASDDFLIPVEEARWAKEDFQASGIVLTIVQPQRLAGQVVAFHFDFPEPWEHWYKPDALYTGLIGTGHIGLLAFICDPAWPAASTKRGSGATNPQGGANRRQPSGSETNRTSAAAASRRSP